MSDDPGAIPELAACRHAQQNVATVREVPWPGCHQGSRVSARESPGVEASRNARQFVTGPKSA
ncbi:hypothetical protein GCM10010464_12230 [Pseudonocardia yunnanensis]|uniref:Uncharacterized protein n=1 Tax=Pseudonocardia yunnanensis TaxID=58107 RepID=A0ABW4F846_9PSEU